jgi:cytoskeleton protein RodZ
MSAKPTLGAYLRRGRERSGLSMDAVAAGSRIVPRLVEALEADRQEFLPAPVYVRGFIRAYCEQIGADTEEALRLYDEQAAPPPPLNVQPQSPEAPKVSAARRWGRVAALSAVGVVLGVAGFALLGRRQPDALASRGNGAVATASTRPAPPPAPPAQPQPPVVVPAPAPAAPSTSATAPAPPAAPVSSAPKPADRVLVMRATDTTWIRVQPDGAPATEETLAPGAVREWRTSGRFQVTLGNAGGVELELDGRALPALGTAGQVVKDAILPGEFSP